MSGIEVNKGCDIFPSAVFIDRVSIMGRVQKEFLNTEFRKVCVHGEKGMEKKACHGGKPFLKAEIQEDHCRNRKPYTCRGGNRKNNIPGESPNPSYSPAENTGVYSCRQCSLYPYNRRSVFPLLCGSTDRGAISGKGQMAGIDQFLADRKIQELLLIETENKENRIFRFQLPAFQKRKKFGSSAGRVTGSLIAFLFPFHFRETVLRGKVVGIILPDTGKESIKSTDTGSIPERESVEDGIKRSFPEHAAPDSVEVTFSFKASR